MVVLMRQRRDAQVEEARWIHVPREQALERPVEAETIAQLRFANFTTVADVIPQPVTFGDRVDHDVHLCRGADRVARPERGAAQWGPGHRVLARFTGGSKGQADRPRADGGNGAQPEFGLAHAHPALSGNEHRSLDGSWYGVSGEVGTDYRWRLAVRTCRASLRPL